MQRDRLPALISQAGTVDSPRSRTEPYCRTAGLLRGAGRHRRGATLVEVDRRNSEHHAENDAGNATPHQQAFDGHRRCGVEQEPESGATANEHEDQSRHQHNVWRVDRRIRIVTLPVAELVGVVLGLEAITTIVLHWRHEKLLNVANGRLLLTLKTKHLTKEHSIKNAFRQRRKGSLHANISEKDAYISKETTQRVVSTDR